MTFIKHFLGYIVGFCLACLFFLCWLCFCSPIYEVIADSRWWRYTSVVFHQEFCTSMWIFSPFWVNFDISCEVGTQLHSFACDYPLIPEKAVAPHSSVLAWRVPGMGQPGGLPSVGSHRVWHDWSDLAALYLFLLECVLFPLACFRFILHIFFSFLRYMCLVYRKH